MQSQNEVNSASTAKDPLHSEGGRKIILRFLFWSFAITWIFLFPALGLQGRQVTLNFLYLFTFSFSPSAILSLLGNLGPAAAAVLVLSGRAHRQDLKTLCREAFALRVSAWSYLFALGIPCLILGLAILELSAIAGIPVTLYQGAFGMWLERFLFDGLLRAFGEEVGWRGFLLPRLQERMSGLGASLLLGLAWWTWHLPLHLDPAGPLRLFGHTIYLVELLSLSLILTWLRNVTKGSLVPVTVFHAALNAGLGTLQFPNDQWILSRWSFCLVFTLLFAAGLVLAILGPQLGANRNASANR